MIRVTVPRHRLPAHAQIPARVDRLGVGGEELPDGAGHGDVEGRTDVDLGDASRDGGHELVVRYAGRAVQDEGDVQGGGQPLQEVVVEGCRTGGHGVGAADGHSQGVHPRVGDEGMGLGGVGTGAGFVRVQRRPAVLAAHLSQLRLHPEPLGVRPVGGGPGRGEVLGIRKPCRVVHHGAESGAGRLPQQVVAPHVVEVQRDGYGGAFGGRGGGAGQWQESSVAELDGVLADLEDDGRTHLLRTGDDGLDMLQGDDVERGDGRAGVGGPGDELTGGDDRHGHSIPVSESTSVRRLCPDLS